MKIGIMSDTHGDFPGFLRAVDAMGPCDYYLHAGDVLAHGMRRSLSSRCGYTDLAASLTAEKNFIFVRGNCDFDADGSLIGHDISAYDRIVRLDGLTFYITHGHRDTVRERIVKAKQAGADVLIYGHSHRKELFRDGDLVVVNPGSPSLPRDNAASVALYDKGRIRLIDIDKKLTVASLMISRH